MAGLLYSLILELTANNATTLPISTGYQTYSLLLNIISQVDPVLAARMHEASSNYRPFTVSSLRGPTEQGKNLLLQPGQLCRLHVTLLDGGPLWQALCTCFLEGRLTTVTLDTAELTLRRLLSTPSVDPTGGQVLPTGRLWPQPPPTITSPSVLPVLPPSVWGIVALASFLSRVWSGIALCGAGTCIPPKSCGWTKWN